MVLFLRERESGSKFLGSGLPRVVTGLWAVGRSAATAFTCAREGSTLQFPLRGEFTVALA